MKDGNNVVLYRSGPHLDSTVVRANVPWIGGRLPDIIRYQGRTFVAGQTAPWGGDDSAIPYHEATLIMDMADEPRQGGDT